MSRRFSIRSYLKIHLLVWSLLITTIPTVIVYYDTLHEINELFDASLVQTAKVLNGLISRKTLAANKQNLVDSLLAKDVDLLMKKHHPYEKKLYFQVWDTKGLVVKSKEAPDSAFAEFKEGFYDLSAGGHEWLTFALYSAQDDWWLVVGEREDIRGELVYDMVVDRVMPLVISIPVLLLVIGFVLERGFRPLANVSEEISEREYKQLTLIDNSETPVEIMGLVNSLNDLLIRLQAAYEKESRFTSDVAHEIRTPLSGLLIHTENLIQDVEDSAIVDDLIDMKHSILRLSHLVNQLLASSRSSRDIPLEALCPVNLRNVVLGALTNCENQFDARELKLETDIDSIEVIGDESLLNSLVGNVIDNAARYTPKKGQVYIHCHQLADGDIELVIEDSGPGIPEDMFDSVKQRFFRMNPGVGEGSGLGLSIVDSIVRQLDIRWQLGRSDLGGLQHRFLFVQNSYS